MTQLRRKLLVSLLLLVPSAGAYLVHWAIFHNSHDIFYYLLMDVAFLFVQAVLAMLILDGLLNAHEHYPFLFSLAVRTNPFDPGAQVEIP